MGGKDAPSEAHSERGKARERFSSGYGRFSAADKLLQIWGGRQTRKNEYFLCGSAGKANSERAALPECRLSLIRSNNSHIGRCFCAYAGRKNTQVTSHRRHHLYHTLGDGGLSGKTLENAPFPSKNTQIKPELSFGNLGRKQRHAGKRSERGVGGRLPEESLLLRCFSGKYFVRSPL